MLSNDPKHRLVAERRTAPEVSHADNYRLCSKSEFTWYVANLGPLSIGADASRRSPTTDKIQRLRRYLDKRIQQIKPSLRGPAVRFVTKRDSESMCLRQDLQENTAVRSPHRHSSSTIPDLFGRTSRFSVKDHTLQDSIVELVMNQPEWV
jgi:hypothetical protein